MDSRRWSNTTKIIITATLATLAIVLLVTFRAMVAPTIMAILVAFILGYPANWIQRRTGWGRGATVAVLYIGILVGLIIIPAIFIPRSIDLVSSWENAITGLVEALQGLSDGPDLVIGTYQLSIDNILQQVGDVLQGFVVSTGNPVSIFRSFTTGILTVLYVTVLSFWLLKDLHTLQRVVIEQAPGEYQEELRHLGEDVGEIWHAFLRGQLVLAITVGLLTWLALTILGMPDAGGLALLSAFMEFLPTIGPGISMAVGTVLALARGSDWPLFSNNFTFALIVLLVYNAITWLESAYLIPRLVGSRVRLHPAVTFVAIISGAVIFGLIGVLLATPILASSREILTYIIRKLQDKEPFEQRATTQPAVRIRGLIAGRKIEGVIFELDGVLTELDWRLADQLVHRTQWIDRVVKEQTRRRFVQRGMILMEGLVNFFINRLEHAKRHDYLNRMQPIFDSLRGYPSSPNLTLAPGVIDTLHTLRRGYRLALVTTRRRQDVLAFLARSGLDDGIFEVVVAREDVRRLLHNSEALSTAAEQLLLDPTNALIVSDADGNLRSGAAINMATAGVLGGISQEQDFQSADMILPTLSELTEWL